MNRSVRSFLVVMLTALMSSAALAEVRFIDEFENYTYPPDGGVIGNGWTWFLNAYPNFPACDGYIGNYGPNPAPNSNGTPNWAVSNITLGATGQAMNVFSDYGSPDHPNGNCVEVNVFQERLLTGDDTGQYTYRFTVEVPEVLGAGVKAYGFIKLINPNPPYDTVEFLQVDTIEGGTKHLYIDIQEEHAGLLLQWGFANVASDYLPSSRWYDNVSFAITGSGAYSGDLIGVPVPFWAYFAIAGLLAWVGGSRLRSRKEA